jgi:transcriptional regulator PpsR
MSDYGSRRKSAAMLASDSMLKLVSDACDVALVVDTAGAIRRVAGCGADLLAALGAGAGWVGRKWVDLVVPDSRPKVVALLDEAAARTARKPGKWRHVNYAARKRGPDVPVLHAVVPLPDTGHFVVFGRDLRAVAALQQRLTDAQFAFEAEVTRVREAEQRYRTLFQVLPEPILILDGRDARVADANPSAQAAFDMSGLRAGARPATELVAPAARKALEAAIATARGARREATLDAAPAGRREVLRLSVLPAGPAPDAPVFLRAASGARGEGAATGPDLGDSSPDAMVATEVDGRISRANRAFSDLAQVGGPERVVGEPIERWLGRDGVDCDVLLANLRQRGTVRHYATVIRGERGATREVEVNGLARGGAAGHVLALRTVDGRMAAAPMDHGRQTGRSPAELAELIGRVPLKDLVRETTDAIERMCIEAALELTGDNRASAAEMLGLSRQSLYVKLRRFGLSGPDGGEDG